MTKASLRNTYKQKRKELSDKDRLRLDDLILTQFQKLILHDVHSLLSYWPIKSHYEINILPVTDHLVFKIPGLRVCFPRTDFAQTRLQAVEVEKDTTFEINHAGIAEPIGGENILPGELDMVFVPMLAYDKKGFRVGYGKGFYDRYLQQCRSNVIKVGFSYFEPEDAIPEVNEFDIPLNLAITPHRIYEF
ncbi:MAG: 5-formyltetrahydrofolate cyclo-ligase [Bacteroidetes bacterium 13_1_20CM_4_60_6]|nr:MAG: 5-formyltetrahydrofolate cyclo-ligase [Bacteroidetes bacterium 13_1_20CM_4_60_6]